MRTFLIAASMAASALIAAPTHAKDMSATLGEAESLLSSGQPKAAYEKLEAVVDDFWQRSPMFIRKATFATNISGYGIFSERAPIFKVGEPQIVYVEPIGFGYGKSKDGGVFAGWKIDFNLTDPSGNSLFQKNDFLKLDMPLAQHNREIHLTLTVNLTGLQPGKYISHFNVKDVNSEKKADFSLPFEVVK